MRAPDSAITARTISLFRLARQGAARLGWGVADQAMSSLSNFMAGIYIVRSLGPAQFGAFSVAFATYLLALNASRGLATDPLLVRYSGAEPSKRRAAVADSTGTALALGVVGGAVCATLGLTVGGATGLALLALGLTMPGLLLQDSWRWSFFSAGLGGQAFANDLLWAAALLVFFAMAVVFRWSTQFDFMLMWGLSATIAAVLGGVQAGVVPRVSNATGWLRRHRDLSSRYLGENLSVVAGAQIRFYGLAAVAGLASVGALRAAELLLAPIFVLVSGMAMVALPEGARVLLRSAARLRRLCLLTAVLGSGCAIAWGAVLLLIVPQSLGRHVLGASWRPASTLVLPVMLGVAGLALQVGAWVGVRALGVASRSLRAQLFSSTLYAAASLSGAASAGAAGAAWGSAGAAGVNAAYWWWQFHLGLADHVQTQFRS